MKNQPGTVFHVVKLRSQFSKIPQNFSAHAYSFRVTGVSSWVCTFSHLLEEDKGMPTDLAVNCFRFGLTNNWDLSPLSF